MVGGATDVVVVDVVDVVDVVVVDVVDVVVVVDAIVVVGAIVVVVVVVVDVVVVVGVGLRKGPPQPQRISVGAASGSPARLGCRSMYLRSCAQAFQAEMPVVGQPPFTCWQAAVCTDNPPRRKVMPSSYARAAMTDHCFDCAPPFVCT